MSEQAVHLEPDEFREFDDREDRMTKLACYIVSREKDRVMGNFGEALGVAKEYEGYVTMHQLDHAMLMAKSAPAAWRVAAQEGYGFYKQLFGDA